MPGQRAGHRAVGRGQRPSVLAEEQEVRIWIDTVPKAFTPSRQSQSKRSLHGFNLCRTPFLALCSLEPLSRPFLLSIEV